ncbi:hypothetical protein FCIRC_8898 [Fusarium circinatum]|uniref:NmrA-like domain-containing protein n=1 Tax=Fusarium circinatum TaxID=48490 RepID=A0A8H5TLR4_FUSCI|nr:hypothetical protein FCIRC_8898 [Fusarium circinatum]
MSPAFLVAGATGNTGRAVVTTLSELLKDNKTFAGYKILALTSSSSGSAAQQLARLPGVEVIEQNWVEITAEWLPRTPRRQSFHRLTQRTQPLCRRVDIPARSSPCRRGPNVFTQLWMGPAAGLIKTFRETGKQEPLRLMASEDAAVGPIDSNEVGVFAAHLLATEDISRYNKAKYVLNGPEDITGTQIVDLVEKYIGTKVENVIFKDMSFIDHAASQTQQSKNVILSIKHAPETAWDGKCGVATSSQEFLEIAPPKNTPADILKNLLGDN